MSQILDTSIVILLWRYLFYKWYGAVEQRLSSIYQDSQTYRFSKGTWERTKVCFRYSFLGRITEIKEANLALLDESRAVRYLIDFYKRSRDKIISYLRPSFTLILAKDTKEELIFSPVRVVSVVITTAILVNLVLSILLHKQIDLWGWLMRALFLFAGASGLFCQADWPTVKKSSIFLRKMRMD